MNLRTHDRIHEPRWTVIARHARQAAQALTWRAYGHDVALVFRDCTPAHVVDLIGVHFHFTRDTDADRIANAQLVRRHVEGLEQRPNPELEDALVLAMPYDIRESCETALAARRGRLSAPMVKPDDNAMEHFGQLVEQFGETLQQMAPIVADGRITTDDRHHIPEARVKIRQLRGQLAALEAAMERVMGEGG